MPKKLTVGPAMRKVISGPEPATMGEALANAKALVEELHPDQTQTIETIRELANDIDRKKSGLKNLREQAADMLEGRAAYQEVVKAQAELTSTKEGLKRAMMGDHEYNDLMENIGLETAALTDLQDILSQHVVLYWKDTGERQVEIDESNGDARALVVTGKLGKKEKFQTNLFAGGDNG